MHLRLAALSLAVLGALAACSQGTQPSSTSSMSAELFLQSDQTIINDAVLEVELLFQQSVSDCMIQEGFEYFPVDDSAETAAANRAFNIVVGVEAERLSYGLVSNEYATDWGYGIARRYGEPPPGVSFDRPINRNEEYLAELSQTAREEYARSLGGCEDNADETVFAPVITAQESAGDIMQNVAELLAVHPEVLQLKSDWSRCIAESGVQELAGASPAEPMELIFLLEQLASQSLADPSEAALAEFQAIEINVASESARCAESADYFVRVSMLRSELVNAELAKA